MLSVGAVLDECVDTTKGGDTVHIDLTFAILPIYNRCNLKALHKKKSGKKSCIHFAAKAFFSIQETFKVTVTKTDFF